MNLEVDVLRRHVSIIPRIALVSCCAGLLPAAASAQTTCPKGGGQIGFQLENDLPALSLGAGSDEAYTNGARIDFSGRGIPRGRKGPLGSLLPFKRSDKDCFRFGFALGLLMYTPNRIETPAVQRNDRPFAGWLYGAYTLTRYEFFTPETRRADTFEAAVGILGPGAGGRWFQDGIHRAFGIASQVGQPYKKPLGWHHQLRNEVGFNLRILRQQLLAGSPIVPRGSGRTRSWDLVGHAGGSAGNIFTLAQGGATARLGFNVPNDLGPQQVPLSVPPLGRAIRPQQEFPRTPARRAPDWSAYVFARTEGRLVLRNAFLDGNLFATDRPDRGVVQKTPVVGDLDWGGVVRVGWARITYHNITRSSEFKTPRGLPEGSVNNHRHRYGSIAIMCGRGL